MSDSVDIAEAMVGFLNVQEFSSYTGFNAERLYWPVHKVESNAGLVVSVFQGRRSRERITRGLIRITHTMYVVLQKKLVGDEVAVGSEVDQLTELSEQIEDSLESQEMAGFTFFEFDDEIDRLPFDSEKLRDVNVYSSIIGVRYRL